MTRNTAPVAGGPSGGQLEAKVGAFYMLELLAQSDVRGLPGATPKRIKFQRGYEGHALDDIIVEAVDAAGETQSLEIQAKRTLDFTASDAQFGAVVRQIVSAEGEAAERPIAAALGRTSGKIERHYHGLLSLARKLGSGGALARALDAPGVASRGMRDFRDAVRSHLSALGADGSDQAVWSILRRFQILVFDFESPGAVSGHLALALARLVLSPDAKDRALELWNAVQLKALSYDAEGGEVDRDELVSWLRTEHGFELRPSRGSALGRRRFAEASAAALDAIDDQIGGVTLERTEHVDAVGRALGEGRYVELVGEGGCGKSSILKFIAADLRLEAQPLVLSPARTPGGGWLALSALLGFEGSADEFVGELAASGATVVFIDGLDRFTEAAVQATVKDLLMAAARTPQVAVVATAGRDFDAEQRSWLPQAALDTLGRRTVTIGPLSDDEVAELSQADPRLAQLFVDPDVQPLARNLYQLRQLLRRSDSPAPISSAALAQSWWEGGEPLPRQRRRERLRALRTLARQALTGAVRLDIEALEGEALEDLIRADEIVEVQTGAQAVFRHDLLRDWAVANRLREAPDLVEALPMKGLAPVGLARALELYARMLAEAPDGAQAWAGLMARCERAGVHPSWARAVLLALVRSELSPSVLDRASDALLAGHGELLVRLIRLTVASESEPAADRFARAGRTDLPVPDGVRLPRGLAWFRFTQWLLLRLDQIDVPIGRDLLHLFGAWLLANAAYDPLRAHILAVLFGWLSVLEGGLGEGDLADRTNPLFVEEGRFGPGLAVQREVRFQFLMFCDQEVLATAYLKAHGAGRGRYEVVSDILRYGQALARCAPAAMAQFAGDALVGADQRYGRQDGGNDRRLRLDLYFDGWIEAGPERGPFLATLRGDPAQGLALIRRVVAYQLELDCRPQSGANGDFALSLDGRDLQVIAPESYLVSRTVGSRQVIGSALRALEAWGHEQIKGARALDEVMADILVDPAPAAVLAVAVDILLSHADKADRRLVPFITSPELLTLDGERLTVDLSGVNQLETEEGKVGPGRWSNAALREQASRGRALSWAVGEFLFADDADLLADVKARLEAARDRLPPLPDAEEVFGPRWHIVRALRLLDRANYRDVSGQVGAAAGSLHEYVEPADEQAELNPRREQSLAAAEEMTLSLRLVDAALKAAPLDLDLLARGLAWARGQQTETLGESEEDFERAQTWRAVVATAVHAVTSDDCDDRAWGLAILRRAGQAVGKDSKPYAQVRYYAPAIAALGWARLAAQGQGEATQVLLELARCEEPPVIAAIAGEFERLAGADIRLPRALLRIGLASAIWPEVDHDDRKVTAERRRRRLKRLDAAVSSEAAWLAGGHEPGWPELPTARRFAPKNRRKSLAQEWHDAGSGAPAVRPTQWLNDHSAGAWLQAVVDASSLRSGDWVAGLVAAYDSFSLDAWGRGLAQDADLGEFPERWLRPFDELRLRVFSQKEAAAFDAAVIAPVLELPDDGFLECIEWLVPAMDSLCWDQKALDVGRLALARTRFVERFTQSRGWRWSRAGVADTLPSDVVPSLQALFFHTPAPFNTGRCYLPAEAQDLAPTLPRLVDLACEAPGLSWAASLCLRLFESAQAWVSLDLVCRAAEAWIEARPSDSRFWRDSGFGRRLCVLLSAQQARLSADPTLGARARALLAAFVAVGVSEALTLERELDSDPAQLG